MGRKRCFLGFLVSLFMAFFVADAFAANYTCETYRKYTACKAGYYMTLDGEFNATPTLGNKCTICPAGYYCPGGELSLTPQNKVACPAGTYGATTGLTTSACSGQCAAGYYCPQGSTSSTAYDCDNGSTTSNSNNIWTSKEGAGARTQCYRRISVNKSGGTGNLGVPDYVDAMSHTFEGYSNGYTKCYYGKDCNLYSITNATSEEDTTINHLSKPGYTYCGGYSTSTQQDYATSCSTTIQFNVTSTAADYTFYASRRSNKCYVTVDPNGGSFVAVPGVLTWYHGKSLDGTTYFTVPTAPDVTKTFAGYATASGEKILDANLRSINGTWDSVAAGCDDGENLTLYAVWVSASAIHCDPKYYLPKNSTTCETCPAGNYCVGGDFDPSETADQGLTKCPAGTYNPRSGAQNVSACSVCSGEGTYSNAGATTCSKCSDLGGANTTIATAYDTSIRYTNEAGGTAANHAGTGSCKITCPAGMAVWTQGGLCGVITASTYNSMFVNARIPSAELGNTNYRDLYGLGWYSDENVWAFGDSVQNRLNKGGYPNNIGVRLCADLPVSPTYAQAQPSTSGLASFKADYTVETAAAHAGISACKAQEAMSGTFPGGATLQSSDGTTLNRELVNCAAGNYCPAGTGYGFPADVRTGFVNWVDCDSEDDDAFGVVPVPDNNVWTSDSGAASHSQCYRDIILDKNGMSGALTLPSNHGCKGLKAGASLDANETLQVYFDKECKLPTNQLRGSIGNYTTYDGAGTWSTQEVTKNHQGQVKLKTTSSYSTITLFSEYYVACDGGSYLPAGEAVCEICPGGDKYCPLSIGLLPYQDSDSGLSTCPGSSSSDVGAASQNDCYYPIILDKNGFSATLTSNNGNCEVVDPSPMLNGLLKARYNTRCQLPGVNGTQTGYIDGTGWANTSGFTTPAKFLSAFAPRTSLPAVSTLYIAKTGCTEDYYGDITAATCSLCADIEGTDGFYDKNGEPATLENGGLELGKKVCYGVTEPGEYIGRENMAPFPCADGGYCPGGAYVAYGTTGGLIACAMLDPTATSDNGEFKSELPRTTPTDCRYKTNVLPDRPNCASVESNWVEYVDESTGYSDNTYNVVAKPGTFIQDDGTLGATCVQCSVSSSAAGGSATSCTACQDGRTTTGVGQSSCNTSCANANGADEWFEAEWSLDNAVLNSCAIKSCEGGMLLQNNACVACPANAICDGSADWTCDKNYNKTDTGCELGIFTCTAGLTHDGKQCPAGSYCPGGDVLAGTESGSNGCARPCPDDILRNGTVSSDAGAESVGMCRTTRKGTELPSGKGSGDQVCAYGINDDATDNYAGKCSITIKSCIAGYYLASESDSDCSLAGIGFYSGGDDIKLYACSALSGANSDTKTETTGSDSAEDCYNTCLELPIGSIGSRVPVDAEVFFDEVLGLIPDCSYYTECNSGYHADGENCEPNLYTIELNHNNGTSSINRIYWKYNDGWYTDQSANEESKITTIEKPYLAGQTFGGYVAGTSLIVSNDGTLNTGKRLFSSSNTDEVIYAKAIWTENPSIECKAGTYYSGWGTECAPCPAGSFCVGTSAIQDSGVEAGIQTCSSLNGAYEAATDENGIALEVSITSDEKSTDAESCYATNVKYVSKTNNASGAQTCFYNEALGRYNLECYAQIVSKCVAGYYLPSVINTDCIKVGNGYYSAENETVRHMCPGYGNSGVTVTTSTETSDAINACKMGEIWTKTEHGATRSSCYHKLGAAPDDLSDVSGYKNGDNCDKTVFVACDGGYWYDPSQSTTDCVSVGNGYYSPAQSYYTSELLEPLSNEPGTSIERFYCGDDIDTKDADGNMIETADSATYCEGLCEENYFCVPGDEPKSCADATNGEFPYSSVGSDDIGDCYKKGCTFRCNSTSGIVADRWSQMCKEVYNSTVCTRTYTKIEGVMFYGSTTCMLHPDVDIPKECVIVSCNMNNYYNNSKDKCEPCSSMGDGTFNRSLGGTMFPPNPESGAKACYKEVDLPCTEPVCPLTDRGECSFKGYSSDDSSTYAGYGGYLFYGEDAALPGISKAFLCPDSGWTCRLGYDKTDADNDPSDCSLVRPDCTTDSGTCIPCKSAPDDLCTPHVYTITLQGGYEGGKDETVYQKYKEGWYSDEEASNKIEKVDAPKRDNWTFNGYYSGPGNMVIDKNGEFVYGDAINAKYTNDMIFYAGWTRNTYTCNAGRYYEANATGTDSIEKECVAPYYCPGIGDVNVGETGCRSECPAPNTEPINKQGTVEAGQIDVTSCYANFATNPSDGKELDNGDGTWLCQYTGTSDFGGYENCEIKVNECNAGYYNDSATKACVSVLSGYYSPDKALEQIACPPKDNYAVGSTEPRALVADCYVDCTSYKPVIENGKINRVLADKVKHSDTDDAYPSCEYEVECNLGYDATSGANPKCSAKEYVVTLDKNGGEGQIAESVKCMFDSGKCALPAVKDVLTRRGYKALGKWCTSANGTGECYDADTDVTENISANGSNVTLYVKWEPAVFEITLNAPDADENAEQEPVYLKYATGWFSDADAKYSLENIGNNLPGRENGAYGFAGYYVGDVMIINSQGVLLKAENVLTITDQDTSAEARWAKQFAQCDAGYYYSGRGSVCKPCEANHYCEAGSYETDSGEAGLTPCPLEGKSDGGVAAKDATVCYKEGMDYLTYLNQDGKQWRAQGTWTCNFETVGYTNCHEDTVNVSKCAGGYWFDADKTAIDCSVVGENFYSPVEDKERYQCPDAGDTNGATTSDELSDCQKRVNTYVSGTANAKGSYVCNARMDGDVVKYDSSCQDDTIEIDWCAGGYWYDATKNKKDCVEVGQNYYSSEQDVERHKCPHDGETLTTTASAPDRVCQKTKTYPGIEYNGPAVNGVGVHGCYYDSAADGKQYGEQKSDGYVSCGNVTMTKCNDGYYWDRSKSVCEPVGLNNFGPIADVNNSNNMTGRAACPEEGRTDSEYSSAATACYLEKLACDIENGKGEQTRYYDSATIITNGGYNICYANGAAVDCDTMCTVVECDEGFSELDGECFVCPADNVCPTEGGQQTCAEITGGTHTKADAGTIDAAYCYADCQTSQIENAYSVIGRDYYGQNVSDTCQVTVCAAGYTLVDGRCVDCPVGMVCNPESGDDEPKSCAVLTNGTHQDSGPNSDDITDCFMQCKSYDVINGTAVPVAEKAYYPTECEFYGLSDNGNPCEIVDGVCIESSCNYNFEMVNGICEPCAREHAITYKQSGNCVVESCTNGYHPNGTQCESDTIECAAPNAVAALQKWDAKQNAFGACIITQCADGYHIGANACQPDVQACELENGIGVREWNHDSNSWDECVATKCNPGYTNDPSLTSELGKQCGRCDNMYSANGDLAASSYVRECEIAACMYQGEKYTLENNECRLICDTYTDETGTRRWNESRKKCERMCEPGYTNW